MPKLEATLQQALTLWRTDLRYARSGDHPELKVEDVEGRRHWHTPCWQRELRRRGVV